MKRNKLQRRIEAKFGWNVAGLGTYVDEQSEQIIPALVYGGRTASLIPVMEGVKGTEEIKLLDTTLVLQTAGSCGRSASGSTVLTDKAMTVYPIKSQQDFCEEDLVNSWGQLGLPAGMRNGQENLAYEDMIIAHQVSKIHEANENLIWRGSLGDVAPNLNKIDGFAKKFDADCSVPDINTAAIAAITAANVIEILQAVRNAMPTPVLSQNHKIFVGKEIFDFYMMAVTNGNFFHHNLINDNVSAQLIGTTTTIELVHGLSGISSIYAGPTDKMFIGTDLQSDWEDFYVGYSQDEDVIHVDVKYRLGVEFVNSNEFVKWILPAS